MKNFVTCLLFIITVVAVAQRPTQDMLQSASGNITIQPIQHGTFVIGYGESTTIYVDPWGNGDAFADLEIPDLILITDIHGDHLSPQTLDALNTSRATFVVPQAVADELDAKFESVVVIANNEKKVVKGVSIEALPMYNLPEEDDSRHPRGRGNGYLLTLGDKRIYISGDTEDIKEMRDLKNIDVAFVCMNMPYTMTVEQAASAVLEFKPKIVYPFHYRGSDINQFKKLVNEKDAGIEVRLRDWYAK